MENKASIGVIGGSGIYEIEGIEKLEEVAVETPFGQPSDKISICKVGDQAVAFLPRHGRGHRILPSEVNSRANLWALKSLGVKEVIAFTAVGSLKEELPPRTFVIPDQVIDKTYLRPNTFYGNGLVVHVAFAEPFCTRLRQAYLGACQETGITVVEGGTYVCMEGPQFSTEAESNLHRTWGASLIGMTVMPEAKLAREAELCYAPVALVTDYDCWREEEEAVTAGAVMEVMKDNVDAAKRMLPAVLEKLGKPEGCPCQDALAGAIMTQAEQIPAEQRQKVAVLAGRYLTK